MVDPENITHYNLTDDELEERILFWICAAGKNGKTAARCLEKLLSAISFSDYSPFTCIKVVAQSLMPRPLPYMLKWAGIGCYTSKARSFFEIADSNLNLRTCSVEDLEQIYGIGMKTSRCFIMHSRPAARHAGLDTHVLKYLKAVGIENVPTSTPSSKKQYLRLEKEFLKLADEANKKPADFDLEIWNSYAVK
jgi:hypothetical protein